MSSCRYFFSYFPQFHPDPFNDQAWGKGFSDWRLINELPETERDSFVPARGCYDPSTPEYLRELVEDLKAAPLPDSGLMVYHYHFDGVSALSGFERQLLAQPEVELPFFLCWANETWTKRWVGQPGEVLVEQQHLLSETLIRAHAEYLVKFFVLPHYHRVNGRPLLMIYNAQASVTLPRVLALYRKIFAELGHEPLIGACVSYPQPSEQLEPYDFGCEFEPRFFFNSTNSSAVNGALVPLKMRFPKLFELLGSVRNRLLARGGKRSFSYTNYLEALQSGRIETALRASVGKLPLMRASFLSWNNIPRYRKNSSIVEHNSVDEKSLQVLSELRSDLGLPILLNSWNEWSEGAALERGRREHPLRDGFFRALRGGATTSQA
jgi:hypothetical protein